MTFEKNSFFGIIEIIEDSVTNYELDMNEMIAALKNSICQLPLKSPRKRRNILSTMPS
jgi:hypothetical protein